MLGDVAGGGGGAASEAVSRTREEEVLGALARAVASRPLSAEDGGGGPAMAAARADLQGAMSPEALVEAAGVCAFFEVTTKIVDATGKLPSPPQKLKIVSFVLCIIRFLYSILFFWRR